MLIMGIETATPWGSLALCHDNEIVLEVSLKAGKGGGEYLLSLLDLLIQRTGYSLRDIELIAVGTGPGSYTGIRVGLAAVQGLAESLGVPVAGVSTLRIIAENASRVSEWIAPMIDARRGEIYAALYQSTPDGLLEVIGPEVVPAAKFREKLATLPQVLVLGDGSKHYEEVWSATANFIIGPPVWDRPLAGQACLIARKCWQAGLAGKPEDLVPTYLRRVEAEIRLEERANGNQD